MSLSTVLQYAIAGLWVAWIVYWWASSRNVKTTVRHESVPSRLAHVIPLAIGAWMIGASRMPGGVFTGRLLPASVWIFFAGVIIVAAGLGFTVWARIHLGRNWSGTVTLKEGHELIVTGPYRFVRHPIYSGLLLAFVGSAIARGEWRGVAAVALAFAALWGKLKLEERWLGEAFGEAYARYRAEVAALIPFVL
jgi:protein-S-isoprenylcysteine O-methyltransferase Ste14